MGLQRIMFACDIVPSSFFRASDIQFLERTHCTIKVLALKFSFSGLPCYLPTTPTVEEERCRLYELQ